MGDERTKVALCATVDDQTKNHAEKALLKAQISYLLRCERKMEQSNWDKKVIFYIEQNQVNEALKVVKGLQQTEKELEIFIE